MIEWFIRNPVAANLLMIGILLFGIFSINTRLPLEVFPSFELDRITVTTVFRGATPQSVEDGVTLRVEEAIYDLEGIKKLNSRSAEGVSIVTAEVENNYDARELLSDIKLRVDAISTLPVDAERPTIDLASRVQEVISVVVSGDTDQKELRKLGDITRDNLLKKDGITRIDFDANTDYEIAIEISPSTLKSYNLTLERVARAIQQGSVDLSAGNIKTANGDVLIRTDGQAYSKQEFENIPIIADGSRKAILLKDIATVNDGFEESPLIVLFNGKPAVSMSVYRTGKQSALDIAEKVRGYVDDVKDDLPQGVSIDYWRDNSVVVKNRLSTLTASAMQGGFLVLLLLTLFLRPSVAFWVCLGIPVSFMGAFMLMPYLGVTINLISLFGFILVLGIVVDDAIVTGENIYRHMRQGSDSFTAALEGTREVAVPVTFGILTTVAAFSPLLMIEGVRGDIFAQIPLVVIPVLLFSLIESKLILPAHLRHVKPRREASDLNKLSRIQQKISHGFEDVILKYYRPLLSNALNNKGITIALALAVLTLSISVVKNGHLKFIYFPKIEDEAVLATLTMPSTTGFETTNQYVNHMVDQAKNLQEKHRNPETGESVINYVISFSGATMTEVKPNSGIVAFEVVSPDKRHKEISVAELSNEWREMIGVIPGAERLSMKAEIAQGGKPIDIQLNGENLEHMIEIAEIVKQQLRTYPDVYDIQDSSSGGKEEFNIDLKPAAYPLGITLSNIAQQVRQGFFGFEAQRIQRGRDEVRVMVRFPIEDRSSFEDLYNLPITTADGSTIPLADLATITPSQSPSALYRVNRFRTLNVRADADKKTANIEAIKKELKERLDAAMINYPGIEYEMEGEAKEQKESFGSLGIGMLFVLLAIYTLLAIPFKSYSQPLIVMSIIPLGIVGAIWGHIIMFKSLSIMSIMGMLALIGVVVNDSLVLVDYINKQRRKGLELMEAVLNAGAARFRPIMLTSLTTFAGLTPLLMEKSTQAQFLIPMAISLGFGILFATLITLIIIPVNYVLFENAGTVLNQLKSSIIDMIRTIIKQQSTTKR